jgi:hypothetical protein
MTTEGTVGAPTCFNRVETIGDTYPRCFYELPSPVTNVIKVSYVRLALDADLNAVQKALVEKMDCRVKKVELVDGGLLLRFPSTLQSARFMKAARGRLLSEERNCNFVAVDEDESGMKQCRQVRFCIFTSSRLSRSLIN